MFDVWNWLEVAQALASHNAPLLVVLAGISAWGLRKFSKWRVHAVIEIQSPAESAEAHLSQQLSQDPSKNPPNAD